ncbi:MAG: hypothetical protein ACSLFK_13555 [Gemmatimonadaceae bacterium]
MYGERKGRYASLMSSQPEESREIEGRVLPWLEPSTFEIAAAAKLKTIVSEEVFNEFLRQRETSAIVMWDGFDPEVMELIEQINEDRREVLENAIRERNLKRRKDKNEHS